MFFKRTGVDAGSRALRNKPTIPRVKEIVPPEETGGGESGGELSITIPHMTPHSRLLALCPPSSQCGRLISRGLEPEPTDLLLRSMPMCQPRRMCRNPRHMGGPRGTWLVLLHVDHRGAIVSLRRDEIRMLPYLGVPVSVDDWHGGFCSEYPELAREVLRCSSKRCLAG